MPVWQLSACVLRDLQGKWCVKLKTPSALEERRLDLDEKPLVVQLNWNKDDREGRFVLKNENDILPKVPHSHLLTVHILE